jgi:hypothetical protein
MGRAAAAAQQARARARQRMVDLERERIERQKRIEDAATACYLAAEKRAAAREVVGEAEREMRAALRAITSEGADVEQVATLCDLTPTEVRQLTRHQQNGHRKVRPANEQAAQ